MKFLIIVSVFLGTLTGTLIAAPGPLSIEPKLTSITRDSAKIIHVNGTLTNWSIYVFTRVSISIEGYNRRHEIVYQGLDIPISVMNFKPNETVHFNVTLIDSDDNEIVSYSNPHLELTWLTPRS